MVAQIKQKISNCLICVQFSRAHYMNKLTPHPVPQKICVDFCNVNKEDVLRITDYYSNFMIPRKTRTQNEQDHQRSICT